MDTAVIMGVVILNVLLGFYQEGKAETALEALKKMAVPECTVLRDGGEKVIPARELVPGDVVILSCGDKVPADLGLVSIVMAVTGFVIFWRFGHFAMTAGDALVTQAQTATFIAIQLLHLGFLITARSIYDSAFTFSPFSNKWVLGGMAMTIITQLIIIYAPFAQVIFKTAAFPAGWWPVVLLALLPGFAVIELEKLIRKRRSKRRGL